MARPLEVLVGRAHIFSGLAQEELKEIAGRVRLRRHVRNEQLIRVLGKGGFLGGMSFTSGAPRDHFATTPEAPELCTLHLDDLRGYLLRCPTVMYKMLETLSSRLEGTERQLSLLAGEDAGLIRGCGRRCGGLLLGGRCGQPRDGSMIAVHPTGQLRSVDSMWIPLVFSRK